MDQVERELKLLDCGGANNSPILYTNTEEYDGSSWTAGGALGTANMVWHLLKVEHKLQLYLLVEDLAQAPQLQQKDMMDQVGQH